MYNEDKWQEIEERKSGVKILVRLTNSPIVGYFKYRQNEQVGPINANEYIAAKLAEKLQLPIPKTEFLKLGDKIGTISHAVPGDAYTWSLFPNKDSLEANLNKFESLSCLLVFDFWILNTDRHPDNFMYSKISGEDKYHFFLIDHGHSLYGPSGAGPANFAEFSFDGIVKIIELRQIFSKGFGYFEPHIDKILAIEEAFIQNLVAEVPAEFIGDGQRAVVVQLLLSRRLLLKDNIKQFCKS